MARTESLDRELLLKCGHGELFGPATPSCRADMLMMDRIVRISDEGGAHGKGEISPSSTSTRTSGSSAATSRATRSLPAASASTPCGRCRVLPRLDRQPGRGRALGVGEVKFTGQVLPTAKRVTYFIDMKRMITRKLVLGIADGRMEVDGREIYTGEGPRVGLFTSTEGF